MKVVFIVITLAASLYPQSLPLDTVKADKKFTTAFVFGNLHGVGIGVHYRMGEYAGVDGSIGIKSPVQVLLSPPFMANRINTAAGIKMIPIPWLFVEGGVVAGLYRLTEYLWLANPTFSVGCTYDNISVEAGAAFNMPTVIYTQSRVRMDETIGEGEERIRPAGPTFPFFKFTYRAK